MTVVKTRKKLIEVALPLEAINKASAAEKQPGIGAHPRGLHLYWARRPLAAARAVIFAQMVDDPSANPDLFPTEKAQDKERKRLFKIIEELVKWENTTNENVLQTARNEIWASWRRACADNADHPCANELFDRNKLPAFHDPFAGGGALPLEAQRLGLESYATDLNPVAVLINRAMIEIPPMFAGLPPVNPEWQSKSDNEKAMAAWEGAHGLAEDVRYYGSWVRAEAEKRIGHLYPPVEITSEMAKARSELKQYEGQKLPVIAWIWVRTVKSSNPAFQNTHVPLASTFMLSTKEGKQAYVEPVVDGQGYRFVVKSGAPDNLEKTERGTKLARGANFECIMSKAPLSDDYVKSEGKAGRMGTRLMAIVVDGGRGRVYLSPTPEHEKIAASVRPEWKPEVYIAGSTQYLGVKPYGMNSFDQIFTSRQLVALTTFSDLVSDASKAVKADALKVSASVHGVSMAATNFADSYARSVALYLAFANDRIADYNSSISTWKPSGQQVMQTFKRQALQMTWDFPESNVLGSSAICWSNAVKYTADNLESAGKVVSCRGYASQEDAMRQNVTSGKVVSTDPPYYDNIPYADLSDFFYIWLRRSLRDVIPEMFVTIAVPKAEELVAFAYRHQTGKLGAETFFLNGMTSAMSRLVEQAHPAFPVSIYYAFKQSETESDSGTASTGWETFLAAVIQSGFGITGTWPSRTELANRMRGMSSNALASSIVLVCRRRDTDLPVITRAGFISALKRELPEAVRHLQGGNIAPVDLAQSAIGPGIAVFTRYSKIIGADGNQVSVRDALALINQVLDEQLAEQEGDWDADTRWATYWFDEFGFVSGAFGRADDLARAKNTAVSGVVEAGIALSSAGKVRLLKPDELPEDWAPETDERLTVWEMLHHLIRLQKQGEAQAAAMLARLGDKADAAKELAYRLYGICERKKRSTEGQLYNDLIMVWPDLVARSKEAPTTSARPGEFNLDA